MQSLTCPRDRHHRLLMLVRDAEAPGQSQLADHHERGELLARGRLSVILLLVAHRAATLPRVILGRDAEVIASSLICQTRVAGGIGAFTVHGQGPEVNLVVQQGLGVVAVGQLNHDHLLIHGVKVVEAAVHDSDGRGLVDCSSLLQDGPPVRSVTVY